MKLRTLFEETDRQFLLRMQQELLDAGFEQVDIVKVHQADRNAADSIDTSAPKVAEYGFSCDGKLLMYYHSFRKTNGVGRVWLYSLETDKPYATAEQAFSGLHSQS